MGTITVANIFYDIKIGVDITAGTFAMGVAADISICTFGDIGAAAFLTLEWLCADEFIYFVGFVLVALVSAGTGGI